jgi:septum formation protein
LIVVTIEGLDGGIQLALVAEGDKRKSLGSARFPVGDDFYPFDRSICGEESSYVFFSCGVGQVAHVDVHFCLFLIRHHIQHFLRPWRERPDEVRPPAILRVGRYASTHPYQGWQEMIFRENGSGDCSDFQDRWAVHGLAPVVNSLHFSAMPIVLASTSPRRLDLLVAAGVVCEVVPSPAEEIHDATMRPEELCEENAVRKAAAVAAERPLATVIGADTLVFIDGMPLGKPADMADARAMLRLLSGRIHRVCTGVCVIFPDGVRRVFHGLTEVTFRALEEVEIDEYFARVNPLDKAGAYGIQEYGERIVAGISGSFENVMGLPVTEVMAVLGEFGLPDRRG